MLYMSLKRDAEKEREALDASRSKAKTTRR